MILSLFPCLLFVLREENAKTMKLLVFSVMETVKVAESPLDIVGSNMARKNKPYARHDNMLGIKYSFTFPFTQFP